MIAETEHHEGFTMRPGVAVTAEILALLERRPCTARGLAEGLGLQVREAMKRLHGLVERGAIRVVHRDGETFYVTSRNS